MAAKKKNTEGFAFITDTLTKDKKAAYADIKAAAEKKGLTIHPIMYGRAQAMLGIVKSAKRGTGKFAQASAGKKAKAGRPVDGSSKSGQVRALLSSGMSPAAIAKKVGCTVGLVYNVKSASGKSGPGRPPKAGPRRGPGRPKMNPLPTGGLDGLAGIVTAVRASQQDLGRYRGALERIQAVLAGVLA
jgi:hypothetical protein